MQNARNPRLYDVTIDRFYSLDGLQRVSVSGLAVYFILYHFFPVDAA